ncbi:MAG: ketopantoate reductase family protein [Candidatus Obscuribacter sp.]|jgi:2-dehydropantoate 2-reductase|nr:ketopantoate reductase family protein [Candidatus Obscuribacter sp.]MBP6592671.1 ketopantoate reductase family protein [Candidatus Obscuribacter sp.]MBP7576058.1 ketopantoate reductase family protein [Candidatus Obscuribacter sp.]MDQ5965327.1 2-dehydropantoate 2-reductase [Cyanobacteriota bacterium erpe_2018_sw_39hr_WHONDRS-SW48-000098_B_bin.30]
MKIAIMGTGGVGGLFGARLAAAGGDVTFIARGPHLEAIQQNGLQIISEMRGDLLIKPACAVPSVEGLAPFDFVFVTVKLWDTDSAIETIRPIVGKNTAIISFQNGISRDDKLKAAFGAEHIIGGISYVGATILSPGVIEQKGTFQKLVFGEYSGVKTSRVQSLADLCQKAAIEAVVPDDITVSLWEKFVVLVAMSSLTAATRQSIGPVRQNPQTRALLHDVLREVYSVGIASGVKLPLDVVERQIKYLDTVAPDVTASMEYDLRQGNKLELPWLAGSVVELGSRLDVPTPVCRVICGILSPFVDGSKKQ